MPSLVDADAKRLYRVVVTPRERKRVVPNPQRVHQAT